MIVVLDPTAVESDLIVVPPILAFSAGNWNVSQFVNATALDNEIDDGDYTTILLSHSVVSGVLGYRDYEPVVDLTVHIINNDRNRAAVQILTEDGSCSDGGGDSATDQDACTAAGHQWSPQLPVLVEGGASTTDYQVRLQSPPRTAVTVTIQAGDALSITPPFLVFSPSDWSETRSVSVSVVDDLVQADVLQSTIVHVVADGSDAMYLALNGGNRLPSIDVAIQEDDVAEIVVAVVESSVGVYPSIAVQEGGGPGQLGVVLATQPTHDVRITLDLANNDPGGNDGRVGATVSPQNIVFTASNWNQQQIVDVTPLVDHVVEAAYSYELGFVVSSSDQIYRQMAPSCTVAVHDDDEASIMIIGDEPVYITEQEVGSYQIRLGSQPTSSVAIEIVADDSDRFLVSPTNLVFTVRLAIGAAALPSLLQHVPRALAGMSIGQL